MLILSYFFSIRESKVRFSKTFISVVYPLIPFLFVGTHITQAFAVIKKASPRSECVRCHTNVKKLIRLGWEVEKVKPKQAKSKETSGEG
jgi:hypothetical protein